MVETRGGGEGGRVGGGGRVGAGARLKNSWVGEGGKGGLLCCRASGRTRLFIVRERPRGAPSGKAIGGNRPPRDDRSTI